MEVDLLIEAFGTNKQKRALASRRLNQVGSNALQNAVAKAATSVIDKKGLAVLSPVELAALEEPGSKMAALTPAELQKMRDEGG
ncbi:hypothetical protein GOODEAATRI_028033 [Goodea atripinnis]|uniref:Uncharacterized protein n=1 Tax=Goodea atripinnis TaxID=208336 RepID=A0ABV0P8E4_9TELE